MPNRSIGPQTSGAPDPSTGSAALPMFGSAKDGDGARTTTDTRPTTPAALRTAPDAARIRNKIAPRSRNVQPDRPRQRWTVGETPLQTTAAILKIAPASPEG